MVRRLVDRDKNKEKNKKTKKKKKKKIAIPPPAVFVRCAQVPDPVRAEIPVEASAAIAGRSAL